MTLSRSATPRHAITLGSALSLDAWEVAGGSVIGSAHRRCDRANQDSWTLERRERALVGVLADGCGSAPNSQVGAWLGARIWAQATHELLETGLSPDDPELWRQVCERSLGRLRAVTDALCGPVEASVGEALLFTLVGFVLTPSRLVVHAIGDGLVCLDGRTTALGPFPNNAPPYLGYGLLGTTPRVEIVHAVDAADFERLVIASDGAEELEDLDSLAASSVLARPHTLGRTLARINRERLEIDWNIERVEHSRGRLRDDTTVIALARRGRSGS